MVLVAVASVPSARPLQPEPFYPPPKISLGKLGGIRSPPGLDTETGQDRTGKPSRARQTGQDIPQEQEALLGCSRKLRLPLGMTRSQGPSQGPSATSSTSATGGAGGWEWPSSAMTKGAACPR